MVDNVSSNNNKVKTILYKYYDKYGTGYSRKNEE